MPVEKTEELDVVAAVQKEIENLGKTVKENVSQLNQNYVKLKEIVDRGSGDTYDKNFIDKLAADVSARQEALDKKFAEQANDHLKRLDNIEVALKRVGSSNNNSGVQLYTREQAEQFAKSILSLSSGGEKSVTTDKVEDFLKTNNQENYMANYTSAFLKYCRARGLDGKNWNPQSGFLTPEEQKAMLSASDPDGGVLITVAMNNNLIQRVYENDIMRSLASVQGITTTAMEWMVDWDEAAAGWESETEQGPELTTPKWKQRRITVHNMYYRARITQQLIEDAAINPETWLSDKAGEKMGRVEGAAFFTGDGITKPRGILTYSDGTEYGQVKQVALGAAATLTADGFVTLKYSLYENYLNSSSIAWVMNRATVAAAMKLKYGDGTYIWKPSMIANDPTSAILDIPVKMSPSMPTISAGSMAVVLAAWKEFYMILDRLGITVQRDPYTAKPFVEFYFRKRVGGDILNFEAGKIGIISA